MAKFKVGDRVILLIDTPRVKAGATGIVDDDDCISPYVIWDSMDMLKEDSQSPNRTWCAHEDKLELITEPSVLTETGPAPGTEEWWRWTISAQAMQGMISSSELNLSKEEAVMFAAQSAQFADALIAELKGGKP